MRCSSAWLYCIIVLSSPDWRFTRSWSPISKQNSPFEVRLIVTRSANLAFFFFFYHRNTLHPSPFPCSLSLSPVGHLPSMFCSLTPTLLSLVSNWFRQMYRTSVSLPLFHCLIRSPDSKFDRLLSAGLWSLILFLMPSPRMCCRESDGVQRERGRELQERQKRETQGEA